MNKEELDSIIKYNEHAIFMAEIALAILSNKKDVLDVKGVKEIIAMYLLIPYITKNLLDKPSNNHNIPQLDPKDEFQKAPDSNGKLHSITLEFLRHSMCHSFITVEDRDNGYLIIDDRCILDRKSHDSQLKKSLCERLKIDQATTKLRKLHSTVIVQQREFNKKLKQFFSSEEKT